MLTNLFSDLSPRPDDPILGVARAFGEDPRADKVNLSVGVYLDDEGRIPLQPVVAEAEKRLLDSKAPHGYGPMEGLPKFCSAVKRLVFGDDPELLARICTVQTLGGTGALQLGAAFAQKNLNVTTGAVSNPTWGNHVAILKEAGLNVLRYAYYDAATLSVDREGFFAGLEALPERTLVVLHACCHNPTGVDITIDDWKRVLDIVEAKNLIPFLDMAYQGFGEGLEEDARALRMFAASGVSMMAATSSSKNFGLYGERAGALHVVGANETEAKVLKTILNALVRAEYSNPPRHGGAVVAEVLNDPELLPAWKAEVEGCRNRILAMRRALFEAGKAEGADLSFIIRQKGMFSFTGFTKEEMIRLREEFAIYGVENGRICVAGLNTKNVGKVAKVFAQVLKDRK